VEQNMPPAMAVMEYRILLEFKPNDLTTRLKMAAALDALGRYDEAEKELERVLAAAPGDFNATDMLGFVRVKQGRVKEGLTLLGRAAAANPDDVMVFYHLGLARAAAGDRRGCMAALEKARRNNRKPGKNRDKWQKMIDAAMAAPEKTVRGLMKP
jgi:tetratricopeptide (TPR) repeat protein